MSTDEEHLDDGFGRTPGQEGALIPFAPRTKNVIQFIMRRPDANFGRRICNRWCTLNMQCVLQLIYRRAKEFYWGRRAPLPLMRFALLGNKNAQS